MGATFLPANREPAPANRVRRRRESPCRSSCTLPPFIRRQDPGTHPMVPSPAIHPGDSPPPIRPGATRTAPHQSPLLPWVTPSPAGGAGFPLHQREPWPTNPRPPRNGAPNSPAPSTPQPAPVISPGAPSKPIAAGSVASSPGPTGATPHPRRPGRRIVPQRPRHPSQGECLHPEPSPRGPTLPVP